MLKKATGYIIVGFLPVAANFLLAPVYAAFLPPADYALISLATLFQSFLIFFITLSLDSAFSRLFFNYERKPVLKNAVLTTLLLTVTGAAVVTSAILAFTGDELFRFCFSDPHFTFREYGSWAILTTFSNAIFLFFVMLHRNEGRMKRFITVNLLFFFVPVAGTLTGLIFSDRPAYAAVMGRAIGSITVCASLLILHISRHGLIFKRRYLIESLKFAAPLIPYQLMFAAFSNIDRFMVQDRFTSREFGIYSFAIMITGVIPVFLNAFGNAVTPAVYRELSNAADPVRLKRYNHLSLFSGTAVICLCTAIAVPLMRILLNRDYREADIYIGTLFLSYLPYVHYLVYNSILFFHGKTKVFSFIAFFALTTGLLFNLYLISIWGIWAICLSLYLIRFIQGTGGYLYSLRYGFHRLTYIKHRGALMVSATVIAVYNIAFYLNIKHRFMDVSLLNFLPLLLFAPFCFTIYRHECVYIFTQATRRLHIVGSETK